MSNVGCIIIWKYVVKRLLQLVLILFGITLLSFALMQTASGDTVDAIQQQMGTSMSEEAKTALRHEMGAGSAIYRSIFSMGRKNLYGNMGYSYIKNQRSLSHVYASIAQHSASNVIFYCYNNRYFHPLGIWSAVKQNKITDYVIRIFTFIGNAMPNFYSVVVNICICFTITLVSCYGQQWFYQHYLTDVLL